MGTCPFCRAQTLPGDSICYSCGRVISGASGMDARVKGEFMRSPTRRAKQGVAPQHAMSKGGAKRRGRRKRSRFDRRLHGDSATSYRGSSCVLRRVFIWPRGTCAIQSDRSRGEL